MDENPLTDRRHRYEVAGKHDVLLLLGRARPYVGQRFFAPRADCKDPDASLNSGRNVRFRQDIVHIRVPWKRDRREKRLLCDYAESAVQITQDNRIQRSCTSCGCRIPSFNSANHSFSPVSAEKLLPTPKSYTTNTPQSLKTRLASRKKRAKINVIERSGRCNQVRRAIRKRKRFRSAHDETSAGSYSCAPIEA